MCSLALYYNSGLQDESTDLERVQKVSLKIILKQEYESYEQALQKTGLETLSERRAKLCLNFAKKCVENQATQHMFPLAESGHEMKTRPHEKYFVQPARTERLLKSAIPYLQKLLNIHCG